MPKNIKGETMLAYTQLMENKIYETDLMDGEEDIDALLGILNGNEFRTYGETLQDIISMKKPKDCSLTCEAFLNRRAEEKNIIIADKRTIDSWFKNGVRPRKGREDRYTAFRIAFALELSADETARLFRNALLDRAYNPRDYKEAIYYYCIKNAKEYQYAEKLIKLVHFQEEPTDVTIYTNNLILNLEEIHDDLELIEFININKHNFEMSNIAAKKEVKKLLEDAKGVANKERAKIESSSNYTYNKNKDSMNFLYETITACGVTGIKGTRTIFKNAELPKEIKSSFPQPYIFAKDNPTFEELRKEIILLFSYIFWINADEQIDNASDIFDYYKDELDSLLYSVGFVPLYYGNPYDWLFLRCAFSERPIELFRDILGKVLNEQ